MDPCSPIFRSVAIRRRLIRRRFGDAFDLAARSRRDGARDGASVHGARCDRSPDVRGELTSRDFVLVIGPPITPPPTSTTPRPTADFKCRSRRGEPERRNVVGQVGRRSQRSAYLPFPASRFCPNDVLRKFSPTRAATRILHQVVTGGRSTGVRRGS